MRAVAKSTQGDTKISVGAALDELARQLSQKWKFLSKPVPVPPPLNVTTVYFIGPGNVLIQLTQKNESGAADG